MLVWNHTKLWIAAAVGLVVILVLPSGWPALSRLLTSWNAAMLALIPLIYFRLWSADSRQLRARYEEEDPTAPVIVVVVIAAALLSVLAIVGLLSTVKNFPGNVRFWHLLLSTLTIANSWTLVHTMFTLHYADMYYSVVEGDPAPLSFPRTDSPDFWDFVYFSFTIGVACQTADVATTNSGVRRIVTVHALIAFIFNLSILGFAINVSAGLLGSS